MAVEYGVPMWTEGGFTRESGRDDLGLEGVGIGMLQRLIPGVVQTTPNAGYYSFYPYLLARWEDEGSSIALSDFVPYYRRQETAFIAGCVLHDHRGELRGVSGNTAVRNAIDGSASGHLDIRRLSSTGAGGYLKDRLGGFGMFYGPALRNLRLTVAGEGAVVDRVTDRGRTIAEAFAATWESTEYSRAYRDADSVPIEVLSELGSVACLCAIPGRPDHPFLLDAFFGPLEELPRWERRRRTRVASLGLFLEFHDQLPEGVDGGLGVWRRAIAAHRYPDGTPWHTAFSETRHAWRAYQARDAELMALSGLWVAFLDRLAMLEPASRPAVRQSLVGDAVWGRSNLSPQTSTEDALAQLAASVPEPEHWIAVAERLARPQHTEPGTYILDCLTVLAGVIEHLEVTANGFDQLIDDGGQNGWSLVQLRGWFKSRAAEPIARTLGTLIDEMVFQHQSVALSKVDPFGRRDPFCLAEDNGLMWVIREDQPTWAEARFATVNHLLWTLDLIGAPTGESPLTPFGRDLIDRIQPHA